MYYGIGLLFLLALASSEENITIDTPSGAITGRTSPYSSEVVRFLAIPFAKPAVRFEKAELAKKWSGVLDGTEFGKGCMQKPAPGFYPRDELSENCLTLDIYTTVNMSGIGRYYANKAVMVWVHGGGFTSGNSKIFESSLIAEQGDVVVVAIQYRLGAFGFLYTQERTTTNLGLWDQRLALEWVQQNIHAFGGDRQKVTVFGESAGSIAISCHMLSPQVNNSLFLRTILQSGTILNGDKTRRTRDKAVDLIASHAANCSADSLQCLRQMSADELVEAAISSKVEFWPTTGDSYLPVDTLTLLDRYNREGVASIKDDVGNLDRYDTLIGHNGNEGIMMLGFVFPGINPSVGLTDIEYIEVLRDYILQPFLANQTAADDLMESIVEVYNYSLPGIEDRTSQEINLKRAMDLTGDYVLIIPAILQAMIHSDITATRHNTLTRRHTYYYEFDHIPENPGFFGVIPKWLKTSANHADELQYLFANMNKHLSDIEKALGRSLVKYWTNFAKDGHPGTNYNAVRGAVEWKEFSSPTDGRDYLRFTTNKDFAEKKPRNMLPDFWLKLFSKIAESGH